MPRAVSPVVGVVILTVVTLVLASVAGAVALDLAPGPAPAGPVALSASADADSGRIIVVHESGPAIDVRRIAVHIAVDGVRLRHQPPVPFVGARGFGGAPTGPFNAATDSRWEVGERASLRLAGTNDPTLTAGATVSVELFRNDRRLARVEVTAG